MVILVVVIASNLLLDIVALFGTVRENLSTLLAIIVLNTLALVYYSTVITQSVIGTISIVIDRATVILTMIYAYMIFIRANTSTPAFYRQV